MSRDGALRRGIGFSLTLLLLSSLAGCLATEPESATGQARESSADAESGTARPSTGRSWDPAFPKPPATQGVVLTVRPSPAGVMLDLELTPVHPLLGSEVTVLLGESATVRVVGKDEVEGGSPSDVAEGDALTFWSERSDPIAIGREEPVAVTAAVVTPLVQPSASRGLVDVTLEGARVTLPNTWQVTRDAQAIATAICRGVHRATLLVSGPLLLGCEQDAFADEAAPEERGTAPLVYLHTTTSEPFSDPVVASVPGELTLGEPVHVQELQMWRTPDFLLAPQLGAALLVVNGLLELGPLEQDEVSAVLDSLRSAPGDRVAPPAVRIDGRDLVVVDGHDVRSIARLEGDGAQVAVRPVPQDEADTIVALQQTGIGTAPDLHILGEDGEIWSAPVRDPPGLGHDPVWSADGQELAWLDGGEVNVAEWEARIDGPPTHLRAVTTPFPEPRVTAVNRAVVRLADRAGEREASVALPP